MSLGRLSAQPSSWSSIVKDPVINKLLLFQVFSGLSSGIYGILVLFFIKALFGPGYQLHYALFYLVSNVSMSLLLLPGGALADKIGRRSVLRIGVSLFAVSGFIAVISTELWQLLIASGMSAVGSAFIGPAQSSLVADISVGYRRQKSYGIIAFANVMSITIGTIALFLYAASFQYVLDQKVYYRLMLGVSAILGLASAVPIFLIRKSSALGPNHNSSDSRDDASGNGIAQRKHSRQATSKEEGGGRADGVSLSLRRNNVVLKIIVINVLIGLGAGFIVPMFSYYWADVFNLSEAPVYAINILGDIGIAVGSLLSPWLAKRAKKLGGRVGTIVVCQAASIVCAGYLAVAPWQMNLYLTVVAYIARQGLMNMIGPLTSSLLMDHSPETRRGVINSLTSIAFNVPNAISPFSTAIILSSVAYPYGYGYSILALVVLYTIATLIYSTTRKADKLLLLHQPQAKEGKK